MATFRDFDGVYFTVQALRLYQDIRDVEILVVDNYGCTATRDFVEGGAAARYVFAPRPVGTSAPRDLVFREARGEAVLCLDSHVLLAPGVLGRLKRFYRAHPDCHDLLQGPLVDDDLQSLASHCEPVWQTNFWGRWALDPRAEAEPAEEPFDIPMQGLGLFSCRKAAWPGFHRGFRGFGGEEGYIHEKFRRLGRRCLCLPWLRWVHRFPRPAGVPYPIRIIDRITNYLIGHREVGLDDAPVLKHFRTTTGENEIRQALRNADAIQPRPAAPAAAGRSVPAAVRQRPLISCLCPTFGRCGSPWQYLLEEAVESFLRQTDTRSELLILNDHPAQEVVFPHPRVRVVNLPQRFRTLGEKYNALVSFASGDLLAPWEDDDISLPHRLELSRERLGKQDYFNPGRFWLLDRRGLHHEHPMGVAHNLSLFRRKAWRAVGGYPAVTGSQDAEMDQRLAGHPRVRWRNGRPLPVSQWYYIYRWGVSPYHLSGRPRMQSYYDSLAKAAAAAGRFPLRPHWRQDYLALVTAAQAQRPTRPAARGRRTAPATPEPAVRAPGGDTTYERSAAYLDGVGLIEDWGCGPAYFKRFVPAGCYRGIDRSPSPDCDVVADLASYTSAADGILLRHVLEHDVNWRRILHNALASFRRRLVVVLSTPFVRATQAHQRVADPAAGASCPKIHFSRRDLIREFGTIPFRLEENIATDSAFGREHIFYLCKDGPA
jgi:glycosyltransferase involved in cell wall biosynthesis